MTTKTNITSYEVLVDVDGPFGPEILNFGTASYCPANNGYFFFTQVPLGEGVLVTLLPKESSGAQPKPDGQS
jgi:hypothetical protein